MKDANKRILEYIKHKTFIDVGSFDGDSIYVLKDYTDQKIITYEMSEKYLNKIYKGFKNNNVNENMIEVVNKGLGNICGIIKDENGKDVELSTIDEEVKTKNIEVGFIKADIEGGTFDLLKGSYQTILTQKPVLSLAIYHNYDELFNTRHLFDLEFIDYVVEYQLMNSCDMNHCEIYLFAYPKCLQI